MSSYWILRFKISKFDQTLHANIEGYHRDSHILPATESLTEITCGGVYVKSLLTMLYMYITRKGHFVWGTYTKNIQNKYFNT